MSQPTQEQIKEFWEWCGFIEDSGGGWWYPDNKTYIPLLPTLDLNNLFRYAVPKISELHGFGRVVYLILISSCSDPSDAYIVEIKDNLASKPRLAFKIDKDPALALFWAIWEVIKQ